MRLVSFILLFCGVVGGLNRADAGLVSYWKFDEPSGTNAADSKGTNPGTVSGTASFTGTGGAAGGALSFTGAGGQVSIPSAALAAVDAGDVVSVSMWIKPTSFGAYKTIFDTSSRQLSLWIDTAGGGFIGAGGASNSITYSPQWTLNECSIWS